MKIGRYWPEELTEAELAGLNPGIPESLNRRPDVLVVGGGVVGVLTAVCCHRTWLGSVLLIERDQLGAGATGGAGGLLSADTGDDTRAVHPETIAGIVADVERAFPSLRGLPVSHAWVCFRPTHPDDLPVIDRVPGIANAWVTSGHFRHGILLAPATGPALAEWIDTCEMPAIVAGFGIDRFANVG
jgi:glycine/D-amino acid oxidase-like deaminating enzyme